MLSEVRFSYIKLAKGVYMCYNKDSPKNLDSQLRKIKILRNTGKG